MGSGASECRGHRRGQRKPLCGGGVSTGCATSTGVRLLDGRPETDGGVVDALRGEVGGDAIDGSVLDCGVRRVAKVRIGGVAGQRQRHQELAGTKERCARMPVVDEAAYVWTVEELVPAARRDSGRADDLAGARPARGRPEPGEPAYGESIKHG